MDWTSGTVGAQDRGEVVPVARVRAHMVQLASVKYRVRSWDCVASARPG